MFGLDPGQIAQNVLTYFGGAAGGLIVAAALVVIFLLMCAQMVSHHMFKVSLGAGIGAWTVAFIIKKVLTWT